MTHFFSFRRAKILRPISRAVFVCTILAVLFFISFNVNKDINLNYGTSAQAITKTSHPVTSHVSRVNANDLSINGHALTGKGIVIGIYDGGVNLDNSAFKTPQGSSRIISQACFGDSQEINGCDQTKNRQAQNTCFTNDVGCFHGMSVAGFAAGKTNAVNISGEKVEVSGIAPDAQISYIRQAMDKVGTIKHDDFMNALDKFIGDVNSGSPAAPDVINLSLSFPRSAYPDCEQDNEIKRAIDHLVNSGVTVVAATGNNSKKESITYPACMRNVIAVGSSGITKVSNGSVSESVSAFSNMSDEVTLVAPGEQQWGLLPEENHFVKVSGTSFAAPIVSGAIALLKQAKPSISQNEIVEVLNRTGDPINDPATGNKFKKLNVHNAIAAVIPQRAPELAINADSSPLNHPQDKVVVSGENTVLSANKGLNAGIKVGSQVLPAVSFDWARFLLPPLLTICILAVAIAVFKSRRTSSENIENLYGNQWQSIKKLDELELSFVTLDLDESKRQLCHD